MYLAGPELGDALAECRRVASLTDRTTIGHWHRSEDAPDLLARECLAAVDGLADEGLDCYLSIKAAALGFRQDLLDGLGERARQRGIRIMFDSEGPEIADATLTLAERLRTAGTDVSCVLPGRWPRSRRDADWAVDREIAIRVVKGQFRDPAAGRISLRQGFMAVVDRLAGRASYVAIATRDVPLARAALDRLQAAGTSCEVEMVLGLAPQSMFDLARSKAVPVRLYVPYGVPQLPFSLTQLRQNPRIVWWLTRALAAPDPSRG